MWTAHTPEGSMLAPRDQGTIESLDGTTIGWQSFGEGPPLLLANGVGVS